MKKHTIKYCPRCGQDDLSFEVPAGENRQRWCCQACSYIQYFNPIPVVGMILSWQDKILLCQRSIEPQRGWWTYPAGFMELNETAQQGAERECLEEANARAEHLELFAMYALEREGQLHITYRGHLVDGRSSPGDESSAVALVKPQDIEWDQLAFPIIHQTLQLYVQDARRGKFSLHQGMIFGNPDGSYRTTHQKC